MWNNLEHQIWDQLKEHGLENESHYLLAVSGGIDSVVLAQVFKKVKPQSQLVLMHYHHGDGENVVYRDQCLNILKKMSQKGFILETERASKQLQSEADFREARQAFFEKIKARYQKTFYVTAHHQDDVLETRLLKLIRGAGPQGVEAFKEWNLKVFRPFFEIKKQVLLDYAKENQLEWLDDPTNSETTYLRNWLRNEWLPALENKLQGAKHNLAQSIQNLIEASQGEDRYTTESARYVNRKKNEVMIDRAWLFSFSTKDQLSVLIRVIKDSFRCDFTTSQIKEVLRRLDNSQNEHTFLVAGINWVINAQNIVLTYK